jgi:CrcB protein
MVKALLIAGFGGFIGTVLRFLISRYYQVNAVSSFPWGTFTVNIVGCFLIGLIFGVSDKTGWISPEMRIFLTVGICGGFTTFSSFSNDTYLLIEDKEWLFTALYTSLSFFLGLVAVYSGRLLTKIL